MSSPKHLMNQINNNRNRDTNICREETGNGPVLRPKHSESIDECQDGEKDHGEPSSPGLHDGVSVREVRVGDPLCFDGFAEAEVGDAAADPGDEG